MALLTRWADRLDVAAGQGQAAHLVIEQNVHRGKHREFRTDMDDSF